MSHLKLGYTSRQGTSHEFAVASIDRHLVHLVNSIAVSLVSIDLQIIDQNDRLIMISIQFQFRQILTQSLFDV